MAKKRVIHVKKEESKLGLSRTADVLVKITVFLLIFFGLFALFFNKDLESVNINGMNASLFLTLGITWLIIAFLTFSANNSIKRTNDLALEWFLFVLGLFAVLTGRIEGILVIIASLVYIIKNGKAHTKK